MRIPKLIGSLVLVVPVLAFPTRATPRSTSAVDVGVAIRVRVGPPLLPIYAQPICPGPGYIWVPGYWAYDDDIGYYWVPGTWVLPPEVGLLWTPGYWGFVDGLYVWNAGYWGPTVGFYGGIHYGFGYPGTGFYGGSWRGNQYYYNKSVTNVNTTVIHNVYNTTVTNYSGSNNRASFNGGPGGTTARPTQAETAAGHHQHVSMTAEQTQHQRAASTNRTMEASVNHGRPDVAATSRPGEMNKGHAGTPERTPAVPNQPAPSHAKPAPTQPERAPSRPEPAPAPRPSHPSNAPPAHPAPQPRSAPTRPNEEPAPRPKPSHPSNASPAHPAPQPKLAPSHPDATSAHPPASPPKASHPNNAPPQHEVPPKTAPAHPSKPSANQHPAPAQHPAPPPKEKPQRPREP